MRDLFQRLYRNRYRLSTRLYVGLGSAVALTMLASLVGWFSFNRVGEVQRFVNEDSIPEMVMAFRLAQQSSALVAAAPRLTAATSDGFSSIMMEIGEERRAFEVQLAILTDYLESSDSRGLAVSESIWEHAQALIVNIGSIEAEVAHSFVFLETIETVQRDLAQLQIELESLLVPALDDQLFFLLTGYHTLNEPPLPPHLHLNEDQIIRYRYLTSLRSDTILATQLLTNALAETDINRLEPLRERFEATIERIERHTAALNPNDPFRLALAPATEKLMALAFGEQSGFNLMTITIQNTARQQALLESNTTLGLALGAEVETLVNNARTQAQEAIETSSQTILTGQSLLLTLNLLSIAGALLIAWLFVGRLVLRRLAILSQRMRRMADGELEARVMISGRDEIADMAAALEVFRQHALEAQRLNLVEELANELQGKNDELEQVLADLELAQDQVVMQEKLAALGELTAGVAHEIRNPLNFVKNFSEASEELLEDLNLELKEVLEGETLEPDTEQMEYIQELNGDLTQNLRRIREHGERASRIVESMLRMGRGSGEWQAADINDLLEESARLAFHSARATNTEFQLTMTMDLDEEAVPIQVIPQDLSRVFLNMITNACHATHQRRENEEAKQPGVSAAGGDYVPTLHLTTRKGEEDFKVHIRDNGHGIPDEIKDKIFNPFFTTKPGAKGTGLGLSLSSDIIRGHGGSIQVESEADSFTEMIITLPLAQANIPASQPA